jgi:copper(I)-binding protein
MSNSRRFLLPALSAIVLTLAAAISLARGQENAGDLAVVGAWARATPPGAELGAVYVVLENRGHGPVRLIGAASPAARSTTLHQSIEENGVSLMRPLQDTTIAAGAALEMKPGGAHIMLMGLTAPLKEGATVPLTLSFEGAGDVEVSVPVLPIGSDGPAMGHHGHAH